MNRRGFLGSLLAALAAPFVPTPPVVTPPPLLFHKDAFALTMQPLRYADLLEAQLQYESGILLDLMPKVYTRP